MMKKIYFLFVIIAISIDLSAQSPDLSLFLKNHIYMNPAFAGTYANENNLGLLYRSNLGYNYTRTFNAAYTRSGDSVGTGYGLTFHYEKENIQFQNAGAKFHYSYGIEVGDNMTFSLGGAVGAFRKITHEGQIIIGGQQVYMESIGKFYGVLDFGVMLFSEKLKLGASGVNLNNPKVEFFPGYQTTVPRQYYLLAAYQAYENDFFTFTPSILLSQSESYNLTAATIILNGSVYENIEIGIGFKSDNIFRKRYVDYWSGTTLVARDFLVATASLNLGNDYSINIAYEHIIKKSSIGYLTNGNIEGSLNFNL